VVQILAFAGALQSVTASNHSAYLAAGKTHVPALINLVFVVVLIPLLFALSSLGVVGIAFAQLGAMAATVATSVALMKHYLGTSVRELVGAAWRPLVIAVAMAIAVHWLDQHQFGLARVLPPYIRLIAGVLTGVVLYVVMAASLWVITGRADGLERRVFERARAVLQRTPS